MKNRFWLVQEQGKTTESEKWKLEAGKCRHQPSFKGKDHLDFDVEEQQRLSKIKGRNYIFFLPDKRHMSTVGPIQ
jgi:hypothetical protein